MKPGQEYSIVNDGVKFASSKSALDINTDEFKSEEDDYDIVEDEDKLKVSQLRKKM